LCLISISKSHQNLHPKNMIPVVEVLLMFGNGSFLLVFILVFIDASSPIPPTSFAVKISHHNHVMIHDSWCFRDWHVKPVSQLWGPCWTWHDFVYSSFNYLYNIHASESSLHVGIHVQVWIGLFLFSSTFLALACIISDSDSQVFLFFSTPCTVTQTDLFLFSPQVT